MSLQKYYDVIVIGAGPSGAVLAFGLANSGASVLLIEKAALPRYKCCGGGITFKTTKLLNKLGISTPDGIFEKTITRADIVYGRQYHDFHTPDEILMYTVSRDRFDYSLVKAAEKAGAEVIHSSVKIMYLSVDSVSVTTENDTYQARYVAGADGASGITAGILGLNADNRIIGIESEVSLPAQNMSEWENRIVLELGRVKAGYAWVFPKSDHLSVGIGCMQRHTRQLRRHYEDFLKSLQLDAFSIISLQGSNIPLCAPHTVFNKGRVLLIGDAAGLADPLTGEGIHNAVLSAHLAAISIKKALSDTSPDLDEYTGMVETQIMPEIRTAGTFSKILTLVPQRLFNILQHDERVWKGCRFLLRGDISYEGIMEKVKSMGGIYQFILSRV